MADIYVKLCQLFDEKSDFTCEQTSRVLRTILERRDDFLPNWHPLGFVHAKLGENAEGEIFRLHLWLSGEGHKDEQSEKIHDHRFNIESRVLVGGIRNVLYDFEEDELGGERIVKVQYGVGRSEMRETGQIGRATPTATYDLTSPARYSIVHGQLHRTERIGATPSVTLVRTSPAQLYEPRVVFDKNTPLLAPRTPIPFDHELWISTLASLLG